ncbi:hypothetical protein PSTG_19396 [Puccinia striiformis f. sp. tritici PST-78]|uniref:Uncharacterized protein n=1 Tax=Puccinia striiformis f. sp. tritici PST-78 TaxID=1165861 RepID=A0A0L0UJL0_9BASI|nr:hypothetical protein PSTG_19396 [Puccinia striiformis f. sp. tritici PST-78]
MEDPREEEDESNGKADVMSDTELISHIREASTTDERLTELMKACTQPVPTKLKAVTQHLSVCDGERGPPRPGQNSSASTAVFQLADHQEDGQQLC